LLKNFKPVVVVEQNEFVIATTGLVEEEASHYASLKDAVGFSDESHYSSASFLNDDDIDVNLLPASSNYSNDRWC
jgi:hypothetical protein